MGCKKFIFNLIKKIITCRKHPFPEEDIIVSENSEELSVSVPSPSPRADTHITTSSGGACYYTKLNIYDTVCHVYDAFYIVVFDSDLIFFKHRGIVKYPLLGWFQECLSCGGVTGQLHKYGDAKTKTLYIRMCANCSNNFNKFPNNPQNSVLNKKIIKGIAVYENYQHKK